jgi:hypothetical protein
MEFKCLRELELEEQDRCGYAARPQKEDESRVWEDAVAWPEAWSADSEDP